MQREGHYIKSRGVRGSICRKSVGRVRIPHSALRRAIGAAFGNGCRPSWIIVVHLLKHPIRRIDSKKVPVRTKWTGEPSAFNFGVRVLRNLKRTIVRGSVKEIH